MSETSGARKLSDVEIEKRLMKVKFPNGPEDKCIAAFDLTWEFLKETGKKKEWPLASKLASCLIEMGLICEEAVERAEFYKLLDENRDKEIAELKALVKRAVPMIGKHCKGWQAGARRILGE